MDMVVFCCCIFFIWSFSCLKNYKSQKRVYLRMCFVRNDIEINGPPCKHNLNKKKKKKNLGHDIT